MDNQNRKLELLGNAPIPKALLAMGIPTMIGMLINALYNLVDAYFVGGLGESQMAAISVVYPLGQVVVGLGLLFGNGAASYISRLLGQRNKDQAILQVRVAIGNELCTAADSRHIVPLCRNADRTADSYGGADCQLISRLRYTHIAVRA